MQGRPWAHFQVHKKVIKKRSKKFDQKDLKRASRKEINLDKIVIRQQNFNKIESKAVQDNRHGARNDCVTF